MKLHYFSLLILCGFSLGQISASEQPEKVNITDFIIKTLRAQETKWCRSFPGGSVCDPYFKKAALKPSICCSDGSYSAEIMDEKDAPRPTEAVRTYISVSDDKKNVNVTSHIWVKGTKEIDEFERQIGLSDESTWCKRNLVGSDDVIPTMMYVCSTYASEYADFIKMVNAGKSKK